MFRKEFNTFTQADEIATVVSYLAPHNFFVSDFELVEAAKLLLQATDDQTYLGALTYIIEAETFCPNLGPIAQTLKAQLYFDLQQNNASRYDKAPTLSIADFRAKAPAAIDQFLKLAHEKLANNKYTQAQHYLTQAMTIETAITHYPDNYDGNRFISLLTQIQYQLRASLLTRTFDPKTLAAIKQLNELNQSNPRDPSYYLLLCQMLAGKISAEELYRYHSVLVWLQTSKLHYNSGFFHFDHDSRHYLPHHAKCFSDVICKTYRLASARDRRTLEKIFHSLQLHAEFTFTQFQALLTMDFDVARKELKQDYNEYQKALVERCDKLINGSQTVEQFAHYIKQFMHSFTRLPPIYALVAAQFFITKRNYTLARSFLTAAGDRPYYSTPAIISNACMYLQFRCEYNLAKINRSMDSNNYLTAVTTLSSALLNDIKAITFTTSGYTQLVTAIIELTKLTNAPVDQAIARLDKNTLESCYASEVSTPTLSVALVLMILNQQLYLSPLDPAVYFYRAQEFLVTNAVSRIFRIVYLCMAPLLWNAKLNSVSNFTLTIDHFNQELLAFIRRIDKALYEKLAHVMQQSLAESTPAENTASCSSVTNSSTRGIIATTEVKADALPSSVADADLKKKKRKKKKNKNPTTPPVANSAMSQSNSVEKKTETGASKAPPPVNGATDLRADSILAPSSHSSNETTPTLKDAQIASKENTLPHPGAPDLFTSNDHQVENTNADEATRQTLSQKTSSQPEPSQRIEEPAGTAASKQHSTKTWVALRQGYEVAGSSLQMITSIAPPQRVLQQAQAIPAPLYTVPLNSAPLLPIDLAQYGVSLMKHNLKIELHVTEPVTEEYNLYLEKCARERLIHANTLLASICQHSNEIIQQQIAQQKNILAHQFVEITHLNSAYYRLNGPQWPAIIAYSDCMTMACEVILESIHFNDFHIAQPLPLTFLHTPSAQYYHGALLAEVTSLDIRLNILAVNNDYQHRRLAAYRYCHEEFGELIVSQQAMIDFYQRQLVSYSALVQQNLFTPRPALMLTEQASSNQLVGQHDTNQPKLRQ